MMGLRCLALLFIPMKCKRMDDNIPYIAKVVPVSVYIHVHGQKIVMFVNLDEYVSSYLH